MVCKLLCCVVYFSCTVPFSHENVCPISWQHKESFVISKTAPFSSMMTMIMMIIYDNDDDNDDDYNDKGQ